MSTSQHTAEVVVKGSTEGGVTSLKKVGTAADGAKRSIDAVGASGDDWGKKLDGIDKKMSGFTGRIDQVTKVLGAAGLVGAVVSAAGALGDMAERANQISIANQALAISISGAREATMGLVSDYDLTTAANKAVQLGVVKTDAEFAKLSATAAKLGQAMGQSAGQSVDDLTTALGRQSVMILDNLGISLKLEDAYTEYAAMIGKSADQLTDAEKKQGFMTVALQRAEVAAEKANVTLDTQAAKIAVLATKWQNLSDNLATGVTNALAGVSDAVTGSMSAISELNTELENIEPAKGYADQLLRITDQLNGANSAALVWLSTTTLTGEELSRQAAASYGEKIIGMRREEYLANKDANDEMRKSIALEEQRRAIAGQAIAIESGKRKGKGKKGKEPEAVLNQDRFMDASNEGIETTDVIQTDMANEAMQREIQIREHRIAIAQQEQEVAALGREGQHFDAAEQEELAARKYQAEVSLLDFQIEAANTRAEILDLETAKRRKAVAEQTRVMVASRESENKSLRQSQAAHEKYGGKVGDVMAGITQALLDSADGGEYAAAKALAAFATGIRNQMILTALKEFALAAAAAASYNYVGAAQHATAGGLATAAAGASALFAAGISGNIPSEPSTTTSGDGDSGGSSSSSKGGSGSSSSKGGEDDDGVPTSYYDGGLYSKRPDRTPQAANNGGGSTTNNITVLGGTTEQVGLALRRIQEQTGRSLGNVK